MSLVDDLRSRFIERFGAAPQIYRAPGRVNLIGEHTDYNDGFVLPAAIDLATYVGVAPREDRRLVVHSLAFDESVEFDLDAAPRAAPPLERLCRRRRPWASSARGFA